MLHELAARSDLVFATEDGARIICDGDTPQALARELVALGPTQVVIKRGSLGAVAIIDGSHYEAPPERVIEVDPVGAGGAFTAGYLSEMCLDAEPGIRMRTASLTRAFAVTVDGDWEGAPSRADLAVIGGPSGGILR